MDDLRLEIIEIKPGEVPIERLKQLRNLLGGPDGPLKDINPSARWVHGSTQMYLRPETSIHTWQARQRDYQLILWQGDHVVAELYGILYPHRALVGGIHSDIPGGGTHLMRDFAHLAGHRPIHLNAIDSALGFYQQLGLRHLPAPHGHHPMVWPLPAQRAAAELAELPA
jgi:hypothetical protein